MILVTAATGNVGSELVPQLLALGQAVRVTTRDARKVAHLAGQVEVVEGDIDQPETLDAAMAGVDRAFLVSLGFGPAQMEGMIQAAQRAGVQHVVHLSTAEAGEGTMLISKWSRAREQVIEASGIPWTMLRPGQFMSNMLQWAGSVKAQGAVYSSSGEGQVAPIHPRDIASVAAVALTQPGHEGQAYHLTGPELLTTAQEVDILSRVIGKPVRLVEVTVEAVAEQMRQRGLPPMLVEALAELNTAIREGRGTYQTNLVEQLTGRPALIFATWCRENAAAFQ